MPCRLAPARETFTPESMALYPFCRNERANRELIKTNQGRRAIGAKYRFGLKRCDLAALGAR